MKLQVLLVEDYKEDMEQFTRDLPSTFESQGYEVNIDPKDTFESGLRAANDPLTRYDLVISDTYRGAHKDLDAAVLDMINKYRQGKFCPLIVMSSGVCPENFQESPFVKWADKGNASDLENQIQAMLQTGIPQTARKLHDELDSVAGNFLWGFIDKNWGALSASVQTDKDLIERIIRRRAAITLNDLILPKYEALNSRYGFEYYYYPALEHDYFSLGDILIDKESAKNFKVILTPHCHLFLQNNRSEPKAEHILTVKTEPIADVLGDEINKAKQKQNQKLGEWARSPAQTRKTPAGRHWYLPKFLDIPHLYCDFLQVESLSFDSIKKDYRRVATLVPPYAEALQACFTSFYGSVGIPAIEPKAIKDIFDDA